MEYIYLQIFMININHPYREIYSPIDPLNIVRASQRTPLRNTGFIFGLVKGNQRWKNARQK